MSWSGTTLVEEKPRYCTASDVKNILMEEYTELNLTEENFSMAIDSASREVDVSTGTIYYENEVEEVLNLGLDGYIRTKIPLLEVLEIYYWNGDWVLMNNESYDGDYYIESSKLGKIKVLGGVGKKYRVKYKYGYKVVPDVIRTLTAWIAARNIIYTKLNNNEADITNKNYRDILNNLEPLISEYKRKLKVKRYGAGVL